MLALILNKCFALLLLKFAQNAAQMLPAIGGPERTAIPAKKPASPKKLCTLEFLHRSTCRHWNSVLVIVRIKFYR